MPKVLNKDILITVRTSFAPDVMFSIRPFFIADDDGGADVASDVLDVWTRITGLRWNLVKPTVKVNPLTEDRPDEEGRQYYFTLPHPIDNKADVTFYWTM